VVIGLSGGIDSAVTAVIAVEALGAENVLGVLLPSKISSDHSVTDAEALVSNLGIESVTFPIAAPVDAVEAELSEAFSVWGMSEPDVTEENIQARIRGVLLMAVSNKTGRMLLTTGNKSEMAVGYATLYGDMAGGFAVLKDVYKTDVFALADYMNREQEMIPQNSIDKPPSAELRPDQKDSDSLPDYDELDAILKGTIEERLSVDEIAAQGFDRDEVWRVVGMLHTAEYKRRQAPPGVKITRRAFGRDRRYPITHAFHET
jgi:NAD+ synthase (glutamine-hydrolysing)